MNAQRVSHADDGRDKSDPARGGAKGGDRGAEVLLAFSRVSGAGAVDDNRERASWR